MKEYIRLLKKYRGFRNLWLASVVSLAGDWFNTIASMMIVNRYTDSELAVSWILIARALPRFFLGPFAGVVADRFDRKKVMVVADVLRAGIVLSFLFVDRPERVWLIYVLTVAQFVLASFFDPASSAILPGLVEDKKDLVAANVLRSITWSAMLALGSAIGGGFAGLFGAEAALVIDGATFMLSAVLVLQIPNITKAAVIGEQQGGLQEMVEGFRYVAARFDTAVLALVKTFGQIGSSDIIIAVYAEQYFPYGQEGATALGVLFGAAGLGSIVGPLIGNNLLKGQVSSYRRAIHWGYLIVPVGWAFVAWSPNLWVAALGLMLRMMGTSLNWTFSDVLIQTEVEDRFLGRVFAFDLGLFTVATSTSIFLTGYLLDVTAMTPRELVWVLVVSNVIPITLWNVYLANRKKRLGAVEG